MSRPTLMLALGNGQCEARWEDGNVYVSFAASNKREATRGIRQRLEEDGVETDGEPRMIAVRWSS